MEHVYKITDSLFCVGTLQLPQQQGDVLNTPNGKHFHSLRWKELLHCHWKCKVTSKPQKLFTHVISSFNLCKMIIKAENIPILLVASFIKIVFPTNCNIFTIWNLENPDKINTSHFPMWNIHRKWQPIPEKYILD